MSFAYTWLYVEIKVTHVHLFFFFSDLPQFACYHCEKKSNCEEEIKAHLLAYHVDDYYSVRVLVFDDDEGRYTYRAKHFGVKCSWLLEKQSEGHSVHIDYENNSMRVKRKAAHVTQHADSPAAPAQDDTDSDTLNALCDMLPGILGIMKETGREEDFLSVMKHIHNGRLQNNISLHLLLDIGQFLRQETVYSQRYDKTTKDFWTLVYKLFRGKGLRFFGGIKGEGQNVESGSENVWCIRYIKISWSKS